MLMSQGNDAEGGDDDDISDEDEAAALEELKKEDPELYEMLMSGKDEDESDDGLDAANAVDVQPK